MNPQTSHPFLRALLPVGLAFILLSSILVYASFFGGINESYRKKAALSMSVNILTGNFIKNGAFDDPQYVPFFGSSELRRFDSFHPSVLAEKYGREYRPFLLGTAGSQSLIHYSMLSSMEHEMRGRKAVFVLSPQWFLKGGMSRDSFELLYSPLQIYQWITGIDVPDEYDVYYARRLLSYDVVNNNRLMRTALEEIARRKKPSFYIKTACSLEYRLLFIEDSVFSRVHLPTRNLKKLGSKLPDSYDLKELDRLAWEEGEENTSNNKLRIQNSFYNNRLRMHIKNLKGSQTKLNYTKSPEFGDFELVLHKMQELKMDVLFVIPPINGRWISYTGLPREMLQTWTDKIKMQLQGQGFKNILDMQNHTDSAYFTQDTIHIGWRGWVAADKAIAPFLESKEAPSSSRYLTDTYYLSKAWADFLPAPNKEKPERG
ncbi:MAG: D-alanyl-lipoteichoic acid biosynthesis protein DltD [Clostridiales Family XIII bacterium]|nr:D-alanyl-lipoteichoic acid biosynthesis protein DltD [Clostridiales Family XIII bacterium]